MNSVATNPPLSNVFLPRLSPGGRPAFCAVELPRPFRAGPPAKSRCTERHSCAAPAGRPNGWRRVRSGCCAA